MKSCLNDLTRTAARLHMNMRFSLACDLTGEYNYMPCALCVCEKAVHTRNGLYIIHRELCLRIFVSLKLPVSERF